MRARREDHERGERALSQGRPRLKVVWGTSAETSALAKYALEGPPNNVMAPEYRTRSPAATLLVERLERARRRFGASD